MVDHKGFLVCMWAIETEESIQLQPRVLPFGISSKLSQGQENTTISPKPPQCCSLEQFYFHLVQMHPFFFFFCLLLLFSVWHICYSEQFHQVDLIFLSGSLFDSFCIIYLHVSSTLSDLLVNKLFAKLI